MKKTGYSIKDLEVLSGVKAHTIRIWEKRYNLLVPARTGTNIRYYTDEDLRRMLNVSLLVRNGFKISKIAGWDDKSIVEKVLNISKDKTSETDYIDRLILYMINFDHKGFSSLTSEIISVKGMEEAVLKIFFEFFVKVGLYWQVGSIFPAQEHYVTNIFRQKIISETNKLKLPEHNKATILFFLPDNELHELSLLFYNYLALKMGFQTVYLGQMVPWDDLVKIQKQVKADYIFTAFINSFSKNEIEAYLESLKDLFSSQKIFVTGWQIQAHQPKIPRNVKVIKDYKDFKKYLG